MSGPRHYRQFLGEPETSGPPPAPYVPRGWWDTVPLNPLEDQFGRGRVSRVVLTGPTGIFVPPEAPSMVPVPMVRVLWWWWFGGGGRWQGAVVLISICVEWRGERVAT